MLPVRQHVTVPLSFANSSNKFSADYFSEVGLVLILAAITAYIKLM
jgi:hypothetical protein